MHPGDRAMASPVIVPFGDDAVLVDLREPPGLRSARRARMLAGALQALRTGMPGLGEPIAAAANVLLPFDALLLDPERVTALVEPLLLVLPADPGPTPGAREHRIEVAYGGEAGPDLVTVAAETGLAPDEVVALHASVEYEVLFLGFAPGFAYLGELPDALRVARLATPRVRVPAGSVAIAGGATAAYPQASPGGWRLLGATSTRLFDPGAVEPALLRPGDLVRFVPV